MATTLTSTLVELDQLPPGQYELSYTLDTAYLSGQEATELLGGEVNAQAKLTLRASDFDLHIAVEGEVQVTCDRCLDPVSLPVEAEDRMEVEPDAKQLDLRWLAYELIIVNLPLTHSHPEGECNLQMQQLLQTHLCSAAPEDPEIQEMN